MSISRQNIVRRASRRERSGYVHRERLGAYCLQRRWRLLAHPRATIEYRPEFGLTIHPDNWKWKEGEHHAWREHEGRGYWHGGEWKAF